MRNRWCWAHTGARCTFFLLLLSAALLSSWRLFTWLRLTKSAFGRWVAAQFKSWGPTLLFIPNTCISGRNEFLTLTMSLKYYELAPKTCLFYAWHIEPFPMASCLLWLNPYIMSHLLFPHLPFYLSCVSQMVKKYLIEYNHFKAILCILGESLPNYICYWNWNIDLEISSCYPLLAHSRGIPAKLPWCPEFLG